MTAVVCSASVLEDTIAALRRGGRLGEERVVLWLSGAASRPPAPVLQVYEPEQVADVDFFRLPPHSMRALMGHLGRTRRRIVAQVHSHPGRAYHSDVDAEWAIIRHEGALSLVLPSFACATTMSNFLDQVMTYEFSTGAEWVLRPNHGADARIRVTK